MDERYDSAFSGAQHDEAVSRVLGGGLDELASSAAAAAARAAEAAEQAELAGYGLGAPSVSLITLPATATPSASVSATGSDNLKSFHFTFRLPVGTGVGSFNGRVGAVLPQAGDYTPEMVGAGRVNPNLLDNWYFANPVNQRGQTEYSGTGYGIDRWKSVHTDSAYTLASGGASFTSKNLRLDQLLEHPEQYVGKQLTFSVLIPENAGTAAFYAARIVSGTHATVAYEAAGFTGLMSGTFEVPEGFEGVRFFTTSGFTGAITVTAAKLELGTQQTLAHQENGEWVLNEIPDYSEQLLRCQRYYQLFSSADRRPSDRRDFRPELRTDATSSNTGTVTVDGTTYYYASAEL